MAGKLFKEEQRFSGWMYKGVFLFFILLLGQKFIQGIYYGASLEKQLVIAGLMLFFGLTVWLFQRLRLKTSISKKSIKVQMYPWQKKKKKINWDNVKRCEIVQTSGMNQWHGGNISFNYERRYSLSGRNGMHITTYAGREYFIGSRKLNELVDAVQEVEKQV
jgi:hypothetical protein